MMTAPVDTSLIDNETIVNTTALEAGRPFTSLENNSLSTARFFLAGSALAILVGSVIASRFDSDWMYLSFGSLLYLAICIPPLLRPRTPFNAWDVVVLSALPLTLVRYAYLGATGAETEANATNFILPALRFDLLAPTLQLAAMIALLGTGFVLRAGQKQRSSRTIAFTLSRPVARRLAWFLFAISMASFAVLIQRTGGLDLSNISAKRSLADSDGGSVVRVLNYPVGLGLWALLFHLYAVGKDSLSGRAPDLAKTVLFTLAAVAPPIYTSSRTDVVFVVASALAFRSSVAGRLPKKSATVIVAGGLALLILITQLRSAARVDQADFGDSVSAVVVNRNYMDINKQFLTSRALEAERTEYQLGQTYAGLLFVWVPRDIWPDKPAVNPGPEFQRISYELVNRGGTPPSGLTELYWNFGLIGALALSFPLGMAFGSLDRFLRLPGGGSFLLYCGSGLLVVAQFVSDSLVQASLEFGLTLALVIPISMLFGARFRITSLRRSDASDHAKPTVG